MKFIAKHRYLIYVFFAGGLIGFVFHYGFMQTKCPNHYSFLNPLLACDGDFTINKYGYTAFENSLRNQIDVWKGQGDIDRIGVYFRDLEDGPIFGINENGHFVSASLLKLPVALTLFKVDENNPDSLLNQTFQVGQVTDEEDQYFMPEKKIESGKTYSVQELINYSLIYSDNWANAALNKILQSLYPDNDMVLQTLQDLGLVDPTDSLNQDITVRNYASIFRLLFNSSYLSSASSDQVLEILSQSTFTRGLQAGVPQGVKVAHKFGERSSVNGKSELHDCGIIYYPGNPYLLCIMTEGTDMEKMLSVISQTSKMVYTEVNSRKI